jgi:hypothetical protein
MTACCCRSCLTSPPVSWLVCVSLSPSKVLRLSPYSLGADMSSGAAHDVRLCAAVKGTGVFRLLNGKRRVINGSYVGEDAVLTFTVPAVR